MPKTLGCNDASDTREDAAQLPRQRKHHSFYFSILLLTLISLIVAWDVTALSLALPIIADQLQATNFQSFWASIAFVLGIAITQPVYASISDVVGRKYALYASIFLFSIGSILFSTARNMNLVIAGRLVKGLGAGGLDVLQTIILCDITTLKERPRWLGVMSMANAMGAVSGPFIGGAFAEQVGWAWLGWINLITVGLIGMMAFIFLHLTPLEGDIQDNIKKLDWAGFTLFTIIATAVALPLTWANELYTWRSWQTLVPLTVGLSLLIPFGYIEKMASSPMIPYQVFDNISIITGTLSGCIYGSLLNPILLYLPLFFQAVFHESPFEAARSTLPICCLVVAASILISALIGWSRKYRIVMWAGWILTTIFLGLNHTVGAETNRAHIYAFHSFLGAGLGTVLISTQISVLASVTRVDDDGLAAGMLVTMRFVGSLLGLTVCSTVFSSAFEKSFPSLQDLPEQLAVLEDANQAVSFIPRLREIGVSEDIVRVVIGAYEDAFQTIWIVLASFSGLATLLSVLTKEHALKKDDVGRQGFKEPSSL